VTQGGNVASAKKTAAGAGHSRSISRSRGCAVRRTRWPSRASCWASFGSCPRAPPTSCSSPWRARQRTPWTPVPPCVRCARGPTGRTTRAVLARLRARDGWRDRPPGRPRDRLRVPSSAWHTGWHPSRTSGPRPLAGRRRRCRIRLRAAASRTSGARRSHFDP